MVGGKNSIHMPLESRENIEVSFNRQVSDKVQTDDISFTLYIDSSHHKYTHRKILISCVNQFMKYFE